MKASEQQHQADQVLMHHTPAWWIAEFRGPIGRQMREAAGSDTLLTGFNGHIPAEVVCQAIAILNPDAQVSLAESVASAAARPQPASPSAPQPASQPAASQPAPPASRPASPPAAKPPAPARPAAHLSDLAAEVVNNFKPAAPGPAKAEPAPAAAKAPRDDSHIDRALKIKSRFGMLVACSYLREKGWTLEEARRLLWEAAGKERNPTMRGRTGAIL
jgi:hypothetical protein